MTDPFESATYFDCRDDSETLSHETPQEAIEAHLGYRHPTPIAELVSHPLTVFAFAREVVTESWVKLTAGRLADQLAEMWSEDYGDPDGNYEVEEEELAAALIPVVRAAAAAQPVWRCEQVAKREYSAAEVEALMRKMNPRWFEAPGGSTAPKR